MGPRRAEETVMRLGVQVSKSNTEITRMNTSGLSSNSHYTVCTSMTETLQDIKDIYTNKNSSRN